MLIQIQKLILFFMNMKLKSNNCENNMNEVVTVLVTEKELSLLPLGAFYFKGAEM